MIEAHRKMSFQEPLGGFWERCPEASALRNGIDFHTAHGNKCACEFSDGKRIHATTCIFLLLGFRANQ